MGAARVALVAICMLLIGCNDLPMNPFCSDRAPLIGTPRPPNEMSYIVGLMDPIETEEQVREVAEELAAALDFEVGHIFTIVPGFVATMTPAQRDVLRCDSRIRRVEFAGGTTFPSF